jgi:peptidoglycan hydrolase-like amidase
MRRLLAAAALALAVLPLAPTGTAAAPAQTATEVVVTGHGYGHGRGLGQYGAYGYAKDHGWSYERITDHFYGGTTLATAENRVLDVLLKAYGTGWTIAFLERGTLATTLDALLPGGPSPTRRAVAVQWLGGDSWRLYEGDSCGGMGGGPFVDRGTFTAQEVEIFTTDPNPDERVEFVAACENGLHRYYRGNLVADNFAVTADATVRQRTMNRVPIESYLRSVVPSESPSSWGGTNGSAPGMHALRAQAVAARSYALAGDTRQGLADTCDDIFCQVYRGFGTNTAGVVTLFESTNGDLAVAQTANQVRRTGSGIARTEFSSSTGGYTAGGAFPAVPDEGDDVSANPNHDWSARIPVSSIEAVFDVEANPDRDFGAFRRFVVVSRNGLGEDGGRVVRVRGEFANGSLEISGDRFRSLFERFGVKSDWFVVPEGPTAPPPSGRFNDTAGNAHAANIEKVAAAGIASGYPDGGFHPNEFVTRGQMATFIAKGYSLPPAPSPFSDTAGDTHEPGIGAVANAGIASGRPDGTYGPAVPITRGQMAVFMARAEGLSPVEGTGGCDIDGHLYEGQIRAVMAASIASGTDDGCFHPDEGVTRGQMATFLARALGL